MAFSDFVRSFNDEWWRVTLFGEPTMLMPVALIAAIWLYRACGARVALGWTGLLVLGGALLIAQKLLYYVGGVSLDGIRLYTMSGHSLASTYVYGSLIAIVARGWRPAPRYAAWLFTALFVLSIGVSRVAVAGHRSSEAIAGLLLGGALLATFLRKFWRDAQPRLAAWTLALPCAASRALAYGHVFEFENIFRYLGRWARPGARFYH